VLVPIYLADIKGGVMTLQNKSGFSNYLRGLKNGLYEVVVRKIQNTRSLQQNSYLWGVVYQLISDDTGMTPEEVHDFCKVMFLKKRVGRFMTLGSTAKLSKLAFIEYVESVSMWAAQELGIVIPEPNTIDLP
jgi:hypothetical protein